MSRKSPLVDNVHTRNESAALSLSHDSAHQKDNSKLDNLLSCGPSYITKILTDTDKKQLRLYLTSLPILPTQTSYSHAAIQVWIKL
jgi:hypothetical protein